MNHSPTRIHPDHAGRGLRRREVLTGGLLAALGLAGCGGGGGLDIAGVSTGGTGSFSTGTIVGFGSIIVNGIRYDDSAADIVDLDGAAVAGTQPLRLGMTVAVLGDDPVDVAGASYGATAKAAHIAVMSELLGPVDSVDAAGGLVVLGQAVDVSATTVIEGRSTQLSDVKPGDWVEVHGVWDPVDLHWHAGRIEVLETAPAHARLTGDCTRIQGSRLEVGGIAIDASSLTLPTWLAEGERVRVRLATAPSNGLWTALALNRAELTALPGDRWSALASDQRRAELEGVIANVQGRRFRIRGIEVDAGSLPLNWRAGDRVEVKGQLAGGVLIAEQIEVDDDESRSARGFELHATVDQVGVGTFMARGLTVAYDPATVTLAVGDRVEAKLKRTPDGRWQVVSIEVEVSTNETEDDQENKENDDT